MKPRILITLIIASCLSVASFGGEECPSDVTGDNVVDVLDLTAVVLAWGTDDSAADITGDGFVDTEDLVQVILEWGCSVSQEPMSTLSGTVSNLWTGEPIGGATISAGGVVLVTDMNGLYSGSVPIGLLDVTIGATYFDAHEQQIVVFPNIAAQLDAALEPVAAVVVEVELAGDTDPGGTAIATANVVVLDGSTITEYSWSQVSGAEVMISGAETDSIMAQLPDASGFKAELIHVLMEPPISEEQLPPNVPPPPGEFPGGLQDRFQVVGLNPFALEEAGAVGLAVDVTTTSGVYAAESAVHAGIPWKRAGGIHNVPLNVPVLLYGKTQASYDWSLSTPGPATAELIDPTSQSPWFVPDFAGVYTVTVTDLAAGGPLTMKIYAGTWRGVITGQDGEGNPVADGTCVGCHTNLGVDRFTPWSQTGHAAIFKDNLNTSPYWGPQCFACHMVGYDPDVDNGGADEAADYDAFLASGLIGNPDPNNWTTVLEEFPSTALVANVQCENCHGPQWSLAGVTTLAHGPSNPPGDPRKSLSADVCATCHGEPLRHARFQQWQLSAHANYEVAIDEGESGSCARCHTANGFLTWLPILTGEAPGDPMDDIEVTWTADEVHPQTCVTCHDPHMVGTSSGIDTDAIIRISGNTPPLIAGFTAYGVGRGAMCMTCHNSRRGLRNDDTFDQYYLTSEATRAPHGSAQADTIMGENAYLVLTGIRGSHSFLVDSCVTCHMEETPPPADLAYQQSGTNHTFYASNTICVNCHTGIDGPTLQAGVEDTLSILQDTIEDGLLALIDDLTDAGNVINLNNQAQIMNASEVEEIVFGESQGRQDMTITFTNQTTLGPYRMHQVTVLDSQQMSIGAFYDFADPNLIKAGWNWGLINNDGSRGVHNPVYSYWVMSSSITSINPAAAQWIEWPDWATAVPSNTRPPIDY